MEEVKIGPNDAGQRLDKFLGKTYPNLKRSAMYKAIRSKKIKVNRKRAQNGQILEQGDTVLLFLKPDFLEKIPREVPDLPDPEIIYEDENLIAMNKPAGLLSTKDEAGFQDTLNDRLISYLYRSGQYDPRSENSYRPAVAHRLDRNTSGLVLAAKNAEAARELSQAIHDRTVEKSYLAITDHRPRSGRMALYMKKDGNKARVSARPKSGYDPAVMQVEPLQEKNGKYLSRIVLETGRFHQIRAGLAFLGTPLSGDGKYGGRMDSKGGGYQLQAYRIDLTKTPFKEAGIIELPSSRKISLSEF